MSHSLLASGLHSAMQKNIELREELERVYKKLEKLQELLNEQRRLDELAAEGEADAARAKKSCT